MDLCRFCSKPSTSMKHIFNNENHSIDIVRTLQIFKDIEIKESDDLPKLICVKCYDILVTINRFYSNFKKSQKFLKQLQTKECPNNDIHSKILPKSTNVKWTCKSCTTKNTFTSPQDFLNHMEEMHMTDISSNFYSCCFCTEKFKRIHELEIHLKRNHLNKNICYFCNTWFRNSSEIDNHIKTEHENCKFLCKICNENQNSRAQFNKHLKEKHSKSEKIKFYCSECKESTNLGFPNCYSLALHIKGNHQLTGNVGEQNQEQNEKMNTVNSTTTNTLDDNDIFMDEEFLENEFLDDIFFEENNSFQFSESWLDLDFIDNEINNYTSNNNNNLVLGKVSTNTSEIKSLPGVQVQASRTARSVIQESYECPKCSKNDFSKLLDLKLHLAHDHDEYILVCNYCTYVFNRMEELQSHQSQHIAENMIIYSNTKAQGEIIQNQEKNCRIFKCKQCLREFLKERNFLIHICASSSRSTTERVATKTKPTTIATRNPLQCTLCGLTFKNHKDAYTHKKDVHQIEPIECIICDKQFKSKAGLEYHLNAHTGIKSFICPYCNKKFTTNLNLNIHIRRVHSTIKGNECKLCDRKFSTLDHLKKHIASIHQKLRNHQCNVCEKSFTQKSHLTQHKLIHTGERRFYCECCLKGFIKKIDKIKHMQKCSQKESNQINAS